MKGRRFVAVLAILIPVAAASWFYMTLDITTKLVEFEIPSYPQADKAVLSALSKDQLATAAASAIERSKKLSEAARRKADNDLAVFTYLAGLLGIYAIAVFWFLWRSPANKALQADGPRPAGSARA